MVKLHDQYCACSAAVWDLLCTIQKRVNEALRLMPLKSLQKTTFDQNSPDHLFHCYTWHSKWQNVHDWEHMDWFVIAFQSNIAHGHVLGVQQQWHGTTDQEIKKTNVSFRQISCCLKVMKLTHCCGGSYSDFEKAVCVCSYRLWSQRADLGWMWKRLMLKGERSCEGSCLMLSSLSSFPTTGPNLKPWPVVKENQIFE